jgi:hypothetical protein
MSYTLKGDELEQKPAYEKAGIGSIVLLLGIGSCILLYMAQKTNWVGGSKKINIKKRRTISKQSRPLPR